MTLRTASVTGLWSDSATWGGSAPPVNADTFAINSGITVTFDVDQSGFAAGMGASTITGTLQFKRAAGTYILKMNGNLTGTGVIDASNGAGGAYAGGQVAQIVFNTTSVSIAVSGVQNIICLEPVHKYCKLSQAESAAATTIHVDTDLTGEPTYWKTGDLIRVDNVNAGVQSEQYTISSVTSTTIVLTSGLTNSKLIGSYVVLVSRNVKVVGAGTGGGTGFSVPGSVSILSAEIRGMANGMLTPTGAVIGGTITGCAIALATNPANSTLNGVISGCTTGINSGFNVIINGLVSGCTTGMTSFSAFVLSALSIITGCTAGVTSGLSVWLSGTIVNCTNGITNSSFTCSSASFSGNTDDIVNIGNATLFNTLLGSTVEFLNYNSPTRRSIYNYVESFDHDQVSGAYRNWCLGGITSSNTSTVYGSRVRSYQHVLENAPTITVYSFRDQVIEVPAGGWVNATCYIQKDASMSYLPNLQIFPASVEPLISASASATATMTNSISTWEVLFAKYQNTTTAPQLVKVRVIGQNASGNVWEDTDIAVSPFGFALGVAA